jgi:hypothetical protein
MQKFTVFSIILSLVVVLTIADVLFHNYLNADSSVPSVVTTETPSTVDTVDTTPSPDTNAPLTLPQTDSTQATDQPVQLQEDRSTENIGVIPSSLTVELFKNAGLESPTLKNAVFSGLVFEFLGFTDQNEATVYQWNLFNGPAFVGSIYEIKYSTDTGGFQGYLNLRDEAKTLTDLGTVNEVNIYGDASFYFNHKSKVNTVHLLIRAGANLYGLEYAQTYHESMKNVFDSLKTLQ